MARGTLAYRNQIGVDHRYARAGRYKERNIEDWDKPVCNSAELAEGQMMLATIKGQRVVVGKCSEGIVAFADRCTHKGGSLADGTLIGCAVQCPWHGSQFNVTNGRVITGPAEREIKTFVTHIKAGEVYVDVGTLHGYREAMRVLSDEQTNSFQINQSDTMQNVSAAT